MLMQIKGLSWFGSCESLLLKTGLYGPICFFTYMTFVLEKDNIFVVPNTAQLAASLVYDPRQLPRAARGEEVIVL